jgi:hypothetical protein
LAQDPRFRPHVRRSFGVRSATAATARPKTL